MQKLTFKLVLFLTIFLTSNSLHAQSFQKAYGSNLGDEQTSYDVQILGTNLFVAGTYRNLTINKLYGTVSNMDLYGNLNWFKSYSPSNSQNANFLFLNTLISKNQALYCVGMCSPPNAAGFCLMKLDLNGDVIWSKFISDLSGSPRIGMINNENSLYVINGNKVLKFDLLGNLILSKSINLSSNDRLSDITFSKSNNIVITGETPSGFDLDNMVFELDTNLNFIQGSRIVNSLGENLFNMKITEANNGSFIIGAESMNFASFFKIDSTFDFIWANKIVDNVPSPNTLDKYINVKNIIPLNDSLTSFYFGMNGFSFENNFSNRFNAFGKLNSNGDLFNVKKIKKPNFNLGNVDQNLSAVKLDTLNFFFGVGQIHYDDTVTSDSELLNYVHKSSINVLGCGEAYVNPTTENILNALTVTPLTSNIVVNEIMSAVDLPLTAQNLAIGSNHDYCIQVLSDKELSLITDLSVYPNPANTYLNIDCSEIISDIVLYSFTGEMLRTYNGVVNTINVEELKRGIYLLELKMGDNKVKTIKFIIE